MVDDPTRAAFEVALQAAIRDRDRANAAISFLAEKLGLAEPRETVVIGAGSVDGSDDQPRDVGPVHVTDGEFFGMSQPKAAVTFLDRAGRTRPQRTEAIIEALQKGGVRFSGKDPAVTFYAILSRTPTFRRVGKSLWGLSAWYPAAPPKPSKANASSPPIANDGLSAPLVESQQEEPSGEES